MSVVAGITSDLSIGVVVNHLIELAGVVALAAGVATVARRVSANPALAVWLCALSPLTIFELVAPGHNDALMIGLMAVGVALASSKHPLLGILICSVAATIKAPAGIAALVIFLDWLSADATRAARLRHVFAAVGTAAAVILVASFATGLGLAWLSPSVLATPGKVHLAITPVSEFAWVVHSLNPMISVHTASGVIGKVALGVALLITLWLLWPSRRRSTAWTSGLILVALAALGPAAWPWYFTWGIALVACEARLQTSKSLIAATVIGVVLVKPDGILLLPFSSAPIVLSAYLVLIAIAIVLRRRDSDEDARRRRHAASKTVAPS
jgi:alpha-1,6-mannosyltransferase